MIGLIRDMFRSIVRALPVLLAVSILMTLFKEMRLGIEVERYTNFVVFSIVFYHLHRQVMFDLPIFSLGATQPTNIPRHIPALPIFVLICAATVMIFTTEFIARICAYVLFLIFWSLILLMPSILPILTAVLYTIGLSELPFITYGFNVSVSFIPSAALCLSLWGSLLAVAASGHSFSPIRTVAKTLRRSALVFFQMLVFPGLAIIYIQNFIYGLIIGWDHGIAVTVLHKIALHMLSLLPLVMVAVILVRAFDRAFPGSVKRSVGDTSVSVT